MAELKRVRQLAAMLENKKGVKDSSCPRADDQSTPMQQYDGMPFLASSIPARLKPQAALSFGEWPPDRWDAVSWSVTYHKRLLFVVASAKGPSTSNLTGQSLRGPQSRQDPKTMSGHWRRHGALPCWGLLTQSLYPSSRGGLRSVCCFPQACLVLRSADETHPCLGAAPAKVRPSENRVNFSL
jgi:hypothetical protein